MIPLGYTDIVNGKPMAPVTDPYATGPANIENAYLASLYGMPRTQAVTTPVAPSPTPIMSVVASLVPVSPTQPVANPSGPAAIIPLTDTSSSTSSSGSAAGSTGTTGGGAATTPPATGGGGSGGGVVDTSGSQGRLIDAMLSLFGGSSNVPQSLAPQLYAPDTVQTSDTAPVAQSGPSAVVVIVVLLALIAGGVYAWRKFHGA